LGGRGRRISEFKASLFYKVSSRIARAIQGNPVSKKPKTKNQKKKKKKKKKKEKKNKRKEQDKQSVSLSICLEEESRRKKGNHAWY
jgi:hypothetical protein